MATTTDELAGASTEPMPVTFVAHGAPPLLEEPGWVKELAAWGAAMPRPKALLVISAHWEDRPATLGATRPLPLVYDFYGFPEHFYRLAYPSPGAPALAARVEALLAAAGLKSARDETRGLDHGVYVPLLCMYPAADVPVLQLSLPSLQPQELFALGRALAPLRREGVQIMGSGFLTHNLRALSRGPTPAWASEFDAWVREALDRRDVDALLDFAKQAPAVQLAHPRTEHFVPLLVAAGAALEGAAPIRYPITGFWFGSFTRRSVQLG